MTCAQQMLFRLRFTNQFYRAASFISPVDKGFINPTIMHTHTHTHSHATSVDLNQEGKKCQKREDSMQRFAAKLQSGHCVFSWVMEAPCNLPSVRARGAACPAFLCLPTATHESFGHSCSRWREMSPRWQSVLCVCVCLCSLPHKRVLLLYKWPESHPRGNAGKTVAGWRGGGVCGCSLLYVNARRQHSWTCWYSCLCMQKTSDYSFLQ